MLTVDDTSAQLLVLRVVDVSLLRGNGRNFWLGGFLMLLGVRLANYGLGGGDLRLDLLFDVLRTHVLDGGESPCRSWPFVCVHWLLRFTLLKALLALLLVVISETG